MIPKYYKDFYGLYDMKSYKDVPGWINDAEQVYEEVSKEFQDGDIVVEIGSLLGQSACRMAELIRDSGKDITFHSIDLFWMVEQTFRDLADSKQPKPFLKYVSRIRESFPTLSIYDLVKHSSKMLKLDNYIEFITCDEKYAHRLYENDSLKFVWLDGDHEGDIVYNDLVNFWPKLKSNGIIAGDDLTYPDVINGVKKFISIKDNIIETRLELEAGKNYFLLRKK